MKFNKPESLDSLLISLGIGFGFGIVTQLSNDGQNNTHNFVGGLIGTGSIPMVLKYFNQIKVNSMEKLPDHLIVGFAEASYLVTSAVYNLF